MQSAYRSVARNSGSSSLLASVLGFLLNVLGVGFSATESAGKAAAGAAGAAGGAVGSVGKAIKSKVPGVRQCLDLVLPPCLYACMHAAAARARRRA